jgi:hypothetical protein
VPFEQAGRERNCGRGKACTCGLRDAFGSAVTNRVRSAVSHVAGYNLALAGALLFALVVCDSLAHTEFAGSFGP